MAHNIATINGQSAIAYIGSTPWHGLGTRLRGDLRYSIDQSLAAAGLDWTVSLEPLFDGTGNTRWANWRGARPTARSCRSSVPPTSRCRTARRSPSSRRPSRNYGATIEVIGALGRGERLWALVRLAGADGGRDRRGRQRAGLRAADVVARRQRRGEVIATGMRAVCQNTIALARAEAHANVASIRHTASAKSTGRGRRASSSRA